MARFPAAEVARGTDAGPLTPRLPTDDRVETDALVRRRCTGRAAAEEEGRRVPGSRAGASEHRWCEVSGATNWLTHAVDLTVTAEATHDG